MDTPANNTGRIKGTEIFVGGLQPSVTEEMIREVFSNCGEIAEIRLMKDKNDKVKGYCFVRFTNREGASKAKKEKNGYILRGKKILVASSSDQDTLFVGNLKKDLKPEEIEKACRQAFQDVVGVDVALAPVTDTSRTNRGFAFVHFATHSATARAHKIANKSDFVLGDKWHPIVDWAQSDTYTDPDEMAKVTVAYVANLPVTVTDEYLQKIFEPFGKIERISISWKGNLPIGFVHFCERMELEAAIDKLDGTTVDGPDKGSKVQLQISIANPVDKSKKRRRDESTAAGSGKGNSLSAKSPMTVIDQYKLLAFGFPPRIAEKLMLVFERGIATRKEIDDQVLESLKNLPEHVALEVLEKFSSLNFKEIRNKGGYLATMIKKIKKESGSSGLGNTKDLYVPASGWLGGIGGTAHFSALEGYKYLPFSSDAGLNGLDIYGTSSRILASDSMLSRVPTLLGESQAYGSSFHTLGGYEHETSERRPFRFDPYTGEAFKFDPFTGEPLQPSTLPTSRIGGNYF